MKCPILFLTGTNDVPYPLGIHVKSSLLVDPSRVTLSVIPRLPRGHIWSFGEVDAFIDSVLKGGQQFVRLDTCLSGDEVFSPYTGPSEGMKFELHYSVDQGKWPARVWKAVPAHREGDTIRGRLPEKGYAAYFLSATDERGLSVSSRCQEREE